MWICDGPGKGHHSSNLSQHGLGRDCLGDHFGKSEAKRKTLSGICGFVMVLARIIIFKFVPTWSGKRLSWGPFRKNWSREKNLIRNMWICDGPGKDHDFPNLSQHGLGRDCLGDHFGKSEAKRKTLSGICGFVTVLARVIIFQLFPTWSGKGLSLGPFRKKWSQEKTLSGICGFLMVPARAIIFPAFPNMVW